MFLLRGLWFKHEEVVVKQKYFGDFQMPAVRTMLL